MSTTPQTTYRAYDPLLRLSHAWNAPAIIGLIITSQLAEAFEHSDSETAIWQIHVQLGYALILAFIALHLAALIYHRYMRHVPVDQAMINGKNICLKKSPVRSK